MKRRVRKGKGSTLRKVEREKSSQILFTASM